MSLKEAIKRFESSIFHDGGMLQVINENNGGGMSGEFGDTTLLAFLLGGRVMLTFSKDGGKKPIVSLLALDDGSYGMGLQKLVEGEPEALAAIDEVIEQWQKSKKKPGQRLKQDDGVFPLS